MNDQQEYRILAAIGEPGHLAVLLSVTVPLARARGGRVIPLYIGTSESRPPWFRIPEEYQDVVQEPIVLSGENVANTVLDFARELQPDLLILHWRGQPARGRYLLGRTLDPLIQYAPCDVAIVRVNEDPESFAARMHHLKRVLVPSGGGPNASLAMNIGLDLAPDIGVTALRVASPNMGSTAISAQWSILRNALESFGDNERIKPEVILSSSIIDGIIREAMRDYDMVLIGATGENFLDRLVFGNLPQELAFRLHMPLMIVRRHGPVPFEAIRRTRWRLINVMTQLAPEERILVYRQVRRASRADADYYVMLTLAAGIAALGLLLDSAAVIIGAMIVAPLMAPLIGIGMGIVQGDARLLRLSLRTLILGIGVVTLVSGLIGAVAPDNSLTDEMLVRTSPSLLDLVVALISGATAAYASAREDVANVLPGVAVAVALAPPLATFGLTLVIAEIPEALGSFLFFLTNLVGIVAAVALVFLWMGFRPNISETPRARTFRGGVVSTITLVIVVTAILGILSARALSESQLRQEISQVLDDRVELLGKEAVIADWELRVGPVLDIRLYVETTQEISTAQALNLQLAMIDHLDRPVALDITVIEVRRLAPQLPLDSRAPPQHPGFTAQKRPMPAGMGL